jgi:hypothetical protein
MCCAPVQLEVDHHRGWLRGRGGCWIASDFLVVDHQLLAKRSEHDWSIDI